MAECLYALMSTAGFVAFSLTRIPVKKDSVRWMYLAPDGTGQHGPRMPAACRVFSYAAVILQKYARAEGFYSQAERPGSIRVRALTCVFAGSLEGPFMKCLYAFRPRRHEQSLLHCSGSDFSVHYSRCSDFWVSQLLLSFYRAHFWIRNAFGMASAKTNFSLRGVCEGLDTCHKNRGRRSFCGGRCQNMGGVSRRNALYASGGVKPRHGCMSSNGRAQFWKRFFLGILMWKTNLRGQAARPAFPLTSGARLRHRRSTPEAGLRKIDLV